MGPEALNTIALDAIQYVLQRTQVDPDLAYVMGDHTESFQRLCRAEAALTGKEIEAVMQERREDRQPKYRHRKPEIELLKARIDDLEDELSTAERRADQAEDRADRTPDAGHVLALELEQAQAIEALLTRAITGQPTTPTRWERRPIAEVLEQLRRA